MTTIIPFKNKNPSEVGLNFQNTNTNFRLIHLMLSPDLFALQLPHRPEAGNLEEKHFHFGVQNTAKP